MHWLDPKKSRIVQRKLLIRGRVTRCFFEKIAQNIAQTFLSQLTHNWIRGKKSFPKLCSTFVIFNPLPKVNYRSIGENSSNLVTLVQSERRKNLPMKIF
jgi:hypothetical protein